VSGEGNKIMKVEKVFEGIRYTFSNDNLKENDEVYPIAMGRCLDDGGWILHGFDFRDFLSGFPNEPHTIKCLNHSKYKPEQIRTDMGYGPIECYYKVIKREKQIKESEEELEERSTKIMNTFIEERSQ
jgi:hypothetical protein